MYFDYLAEAQKLNADLENSPDVDLQHGEVAQRPQGDHLNCPVYSYCRGYDREQALKEMRRENSGLTMNRRALATIVDRYLYEFSSLDGVCLIEGDQNARISHIRDAWNNDDRQRIILVNNRKNLYLTCIEYIAREKWIKLAMHTDSYGQLTDGDLGFLEYASIEEILDVHRDDESFKSNWPGGPSGGPAWMDLSDNGSDRQTVQSNPLDQGELSYKRARWQEAVETLQGRPKNELDAAKNISNDDFVLDDMPSEDHFERSFDGQGFPVEDPLSDDADIAEKNDDIDNAASTQSGNKAVSTTTGPGLQAFGFATPISIADLSKAMSTLTTFSPASTSFATTYSTPVPFNVAISEAIAATQAGMTAKTEDFTETEYESVATSLINDHRRDQEQTAQAEANNSVVSDEPSAAGTNNNAYDGDAEESLFVSGDPPSRPYFSFMRNEEPGSNRDSYYYDPKSGMDGPDLGTRTFFNLSVENRDLPETPWFHDDFMARTLECHG